MRTEVDIQRQIIWGMAVLLPITAAFLLPENIYFTKQRLVGFTPFYLALLAGVFTYQFLKGFNVKRSSQAALAWLPPVIILVIAGVYSPILQDNILNTSGQVTTGHVIEVSYDNNRCQIISDYVVNNVRYKTTLKSSKQSFSLGEDVTICYSPTYPDNSVILEVEKAEGNELGAKLEEISK